MSTPNHNFRYDLLVAMEDNIAQIASALGEGSIEIQGVRRTKSGRSYFELRGVANSKATSLHIAVPSSLSAAETWVVWRYELERCGAVVKEDAVYSGRILNGTAAY